jgi:hypothetical protein
MAWQARRVEPPGAKGEQRMAFCGEDGSDVRTFLEEMDLDDELREDIAHRNAEKLFVI